MSIGAATRSWLPRERRGRWVRFARDDARNDKPFPRFFARQSVFALASNGFDWVRFVTPVISVETFRPDRTFSDIFGQVRDPSRRPHRRPRPSRRRSADPARTTSFALSKSDDHPAT